MSLRICCLNLWLMARRTIAAFFKLCRSTFNEEKFSIDGAVDISNSSIKNQTVKVFKNSYVQFFQGNQAISGFSPALLGLFGKELFQVEGFRIGKGSKIIANKIFICEHRESERV